MFLAQIGTLFASPTFFALIATLAILEKRVSHFCIFFYFFFTLDESTLLVLFDSYLYFLDCAASFTMATSHSTGDHREYLCRCCFHNHSR
jgi:hypothetical protein